MTLTGNSGPILVIGIFVLQVFIDIYFQPTRDAEKWFWHVLCQNIFEVAFKFLYSNNFTRNFEVFNLKNN